MLNSLKPLIPTSGSETGPWQPFPMAAKVRPFGNQTWQAGKSSINRGLNRKIHDNHRH